MRYQLYRDLLTLVALVSCFGCTSPRRPSLDEIQAAQRREVQQAIEFEEQKFRTQLAEAKRRIATSGPGCAAIDANAAKLSEHEQIGHCLAKEVFSGFWRGLACDGKTGIQLFLDAVGAVGSRIQFSGTIWFDGGTSVEIAGQMDAASSGLITLTTQHRKFFDFEQKPPLADHSLTIGRDDSGTYLVGAIQQSSKFRCNLQMSRKDAQVGLLPPLTSRAVIKELYNLPWEVRAYWLIHAPISKSSDAEELLRIAHILTVYSDGTALSGMSGAKLRSEAARYLLAAETLGVNASVDMQLAQNYATGNGVNQNLGEAQRRLSRALPIMRDALAVCTSKNAIRLVREAYDGQIGKIYPTPTGVIDMSKPFTCVYKIVPAEPGENPPDNLLDAWLTDQAIRQRLADQNSLTGLIGDFIRGPLHVFEMNVRPAGARRYGLTMDGGWAATVDLSQ